MTYIYHKITNISIFEIILSYDIYKSISDLFNISISDFFLVCPLGTTVIVPHKEFVTDSANQLTSWLKITERLFKVEFYVFFFKVPPLMDVLHTDLVSVLFECLSHPHGLQTPNWYHSSLEQF